MHAKIWGANDDALDKSEQVCLFNVQVKFRFADLIHHFFIFRSRCPSLTNTAISVIATSLLVSFRHCSIIPPDMRVLEMSFII